MNKMSRNEMWQEMSLQEMKEVNGGFIPLVIWGVAYSAKTIATACGATFLASMAIGALAASDNSKDEN